MAYHLSEYRREEIRNRLRELGLPDNLPDADLLNVLFTIPDYGEPPWKTFLKRSVDGSGQTADFQTTPFTADIDRTPPPPLWS